MLKVTFTQNRVEIEAQTDADQDELVRLTQTLVLSVMSSSSHAVKIPIDSIRPQINADGFAIKQPMFALDKDIPPAQPRSRYTSSLGVSQVYVAAFALFEIGKPATAREIGDKMLAMPGYKTKAKDHMDVVRQILRSNQGIFSRTEAGSWGLTEQGINDVISRKSSFQRHETQHDTQEGKQTPEDRQP